MTAENDIAVGDWFEDEGVKNDKDVEILTQASRDVAASCWAHVRRFGKKK